MSLEHNSNSLDRNDLGNYEKNSNLIKLAEMKKQHKNVNNQIYIYKHKLLRSKSPDKKEKKSKLPAIKINRTLNDTKSAEQKPKFTFFEEKLKMIKLQEKIEENKIKKINDAKKIKEVNRLMRENVMIFKEKQVEVNKQIKLMIERKTDLIKDSINSFKNFKKGYINNQLQKEMSDELLKINEKNKILEKMRKQHETVQKQKNKDILMTTKTDEPSKKLTTDTFINELEDNQNL
jgi:hypothetical protein